MLIETKIDTNPLRELFHWNWYSVPLKSLSKVACLKFGTSEHGTALSRPSVDDHENSRSEHMDPNNTIVQVSQLRKIKSSSNISSCESNSCFSMPWPSFIKMPLRERKQIVQKLLKLIKSKKNKRLYVNKWNPKLNNKNKV